MALAIIALIWLGMILGVSFLATPVKFVVEDLTLPVALQVGQATFGLFTKVEWLLAAALVGTCIWTWRTRPCLLALSIVAAGCVALQALWLLPSLDERVASIVAGRTPPPSPHHLLYAWMEATKAALLVGAAALALGTSRPASKAMSAA